MKKSQPQKLKKQRLISVFLLVVMLVFIALLVVDLVPILEQVVKDRHDESKMVSYIDAHGAKGVFLIIGLQALQVIVAVIPGTAVQVLAGLCYGVLGGTLLCTVGYVLGNVVVFVALRQFGQVLGPLFSRKYDQGGTPRDPKSGKKGKKKGLDLQRITRMENPQFAAFILYFLPGVPNGILPYLFANSKITFWQYLAAVVIAGTPSTLLCTWLGERLSKGDWKTAIIIVIIMAALVGLMFLLKNKLTDKVTDEKNR